MERKFRYKFLLIVLIGILISGVSVSAVGRLMASEVLYDNTKSNITSNDVQLTIDVLNNKINEKIENAKSICPKGQICIKTWNFDYTGGEQIFNVPETGTYKLETWGAQGGSVDSNSYSIALIGGYGAYSVGIIELQKNQKIYVNVGGKGNACLTYGTSTSGTITCGQDGGYNGGGSTRQYVSDTYYGSGGGASHIASKSGILSSLENDKNNVIIVSGGGGGASRWTPGQLSYSSHGGNAGGYIGSVSEVIQVDRVVDCTGGTQTNGGTGSDNFGSFGKGADLVSYVGPGSGSGWYGGGTSEIKSCGGSSYIGNSLLINKSMYCYNCQESNEESIKTISTINVSEEPIAGYAKQGNGYVKITYIK